MKSNICHLFSNFYVILCTTLEGVLVDEGAVQLTTMCVFALHSAQGVPETDCIIFTEKKNLSSKSGPPPKKKQNLDPMSLKLSCS